MIRLSDLVVAYWSDPLMAASDGSFVATPTPGFNSHMTQAAQHNEEEEIYE